MYLYGGIDEAGYGPMFGPLVITRSLFQVPHPPLPPAPSSQPTNLWTLLNSAVVNKANDRRRRIAINDSKKLHTSAAGLTHLERAVYACVACLHNETPTNLPDLLQRLTDATESHLPAHLPWYHSPDPMQSPDPGTPGITTPGTPPENNLPENNTSETYTDELPTCHSPEQIGIARQTLQRCFDQTDAQLLDLSAAVVYEDRYNQIVAATRNKSRCAWTFVSKHLWHLWYQHGHQSPWIVVDRQGGRTNYQPVLQTLFETAKLTQFHQSPTASRYHLQEGPRSMILSFETKSDQNHLPVALASMTAKYLRELLMARFNRFWHHYDPTLKPTAGYVTDGRRFLKEITPLIDHLAIDTDQLIRQR